MHRAIFAKEPIEVGIIERPHHNMQRMPVKRVGEGGELPTSEVGSQEQNSLTAVVGALVIFEALISHYAFYVFAGIARK